jgi:sulfonate transport system substrate-binding protein
VEVESSTLVMPPVDDDVIKIQQYVADRFARLGLIPKPVRVADIVWKWMPGS